MIYLTLAWEFLKIGTFAIGGGLATIPFLYELAEKYPWFTASDLTDMIAVSESTPGPVGINMATYVGYTAGYSEYGLWGGALGAVTTTLAIVLPSLIIIMVIARFLRSYSQSSLVRGAFSGLRPAVAALITVAAISVISVSLLNTGASTLLGTFKPIPLLMFFMFVWCMHEYKNVAPQWFLLIGAGLGVLLQL